MAFVVEANVGGVRARFWRSRPNSREARPIVTRGEVGIRDVAERAGVSVGTVSHVLNNVAGKFSVDSEKRVNAAIEDLGYVPNSAARQLRRGFSGIVGMLLRNFDDPFVTDVVRGAQVAAESAGLTVLIAVSEGNRERERALLDLFEGLRCAGIITLSDDLADAPDVSRQAGVRRVQLLFPIRQPGANGVQAGQDAVASLIDVARNGEHGTELRSVPQLQRPAASPECPRGDGINGSQIEAGVGESRTTVAEIGAPIFPSSSAT